MNTSIKLQKSRSVEGSEFVSNIYETHIKGNKRYKLQKEHEKALYSILGNLIYCGNINKPLVKPYYNDKEITSKWFTSSICGNIFKLLEELGYCQFIEGNCCSIKELNQLPKYIATDKLINLNLNIKRVKIGDPIRMNRIVRKDKKKKIEFITPHLNPMMLRMKNDVEKINEMYEDIVVTFKYSNTNLTPNYKHSFEKSIENLMVNGHVVLVGRPEYEEKRYGWFDTMCGERLYKNNEYTFQINSLDVYRTFNRNAYIFGGRFYTPVFQNIPSKNRHSITINGEETVEIDYNALHINMLYNKIGIEYKGLPYIYEKSDIENKDKRAIHKYIVMIAINAVNENSAILAIMKTLRDDKKSGKFNSEIPKIDEIRKLYKEFLIHHAPIAEFVSNDAGIRLQRQDSDIMNFILLKLRELKIVGLPIQDSVIVIKSKQKELEEVMKEMYLKVMKYKINVEVSQ